MRKLTGVEKMEALFQKAEAIREQYAVALRNAENEVTELTESISEGEQHVQEIYKNYVLNIVSLDAYQSEKKLLDDKKAVLQVAQQKIADVATLQNEELYEVYREIKEVSPEYTKVNNANKALQRKKLFTSKVEYLKAMQNAKIETEKTNKYTTMIDHLRVEIGDKKDIDYDMGDRMVSSLIHNDYNNSAGLDVDRFEVADAYHKGLISSKVQAEANK